MRVGRWLGVGMLALFCWLGSTGCRDAIRDGAIAAVGGVSEDLVADLLNSFLGNSSGE